MIPRNVYDFAEQTRVYLMDFYDTFY